VSHFLFSCLGNISSLSNTKYEPLKIKINQLLMDGLESVD
jgi:hypothetical protein